jgi:hypothetical protein
VDTEYSLVICTIDDSQKMFKDAIGLSTYSNNQSTIAAYAIIASKISPKSNMLPFAY